MCRRAPGRQPGSSATPRSSARLQGAAIRLLRARCASRMRSWSTWPSLSHRARGASPRRPWRAAVLACEVGSAIVFVCGHACSPTCAYGRPTSFGSCQLLFELRREALVGAKRPRLDGPGRKLQSLGDFSVREPLEMVQAYYLLLIRGQLVERATNLPDSVQRLGGLGLRGQRPIRGSD